MCSRSWKRAMTPVLSKITHSFLVHYFDEGLNFQEIVKLYISPHRGEFEKPLGYKSVQSAKGTYYLSRSLLGVSTTTFQMSIYLIDPSSIRSGPSSIRSGYQSSRSPCRSLFVQTILPQATPSLPCFPPSLYFASHNVSYLNTPLGVHLLQRFSNFSSCLTLKSTLKR